MSRADYLNALFNQRKQRQANGNVIVDIDVEAEEVGAEEPAA